MEGNEIKSPCWQYWWMKKPPERMTVKEVVMPRQCRDDTIRSDFWKGSPEFSPRAVCFNSSPEFSLRNLCSNLICYT